VIVCFFQGREKKEEKEEKESQTLVGYLVGKNSLTTSLKLVIPEVSK